MRRVLALLVATFPLVLSSSLPVTDDLTKGVQLAQLYDRPMILVFTGSDWCRWSQKICGELFDSDEFSHSIGNMFIFVHLDFPETIGNQTQENLGYIEVKKRYNITSFPAIVMTQPDGTEITRLTYSEQKADRFAFSLKNIFSKFARLQDEVAKIDLASIEEGDLREMYDDAVEIRCPTFISHLLDQGLQLNKGAFFPVEKYSQLVLEGKVDTQEANDLKEVIVERDHDNREGARLRLALLDFQSHQDNPDLATKEPLSYIADFGKREDDNLWRLHMLISDYFSEHGREEEAKEHAEKSLETAPQKVKPLIQISELPKD